MFTLTELMVASAVIGTNVSAVKTQIAAFTTFLWITPAPPVVTNSPPVTQGALAMHWGSRAQSEVPGAPPEVSKTMR